MTKIASSHNRLWTKAGASIPALIVLALGTPSWASTTTSGSMPWDTVLTTVENDLTGPVAVAVGVVAVVITGLGIALGGEGSFMRRAFGILFGLSVAFMSSSAILTFFGSSGAVF